MNKNKNLGVFLLLSFFLVGCFHSIQAYGVKSYKDGRVYIKKSGSYGVGALSAEWERKSVGGKVINFYNKKIGASIATEAFCGDLFEDRPPHVLTSELTSSLENKKVIKQDKFKLNDRGAVRTIALAETDGVPFKLDTVVASKDACVFDFIFVTPVENYNAGVGDFEGFFGAFQY